MGYDNWVKILVATSQFQADLIKGLMEAHNISAELFSEAAGRAVGIGYGMLAEIEIFVKKDDAQLAEGIINDFFAGKLTNSNS